MITEKYLNYIQEGKGWPDTYYGYKFQDAADGDSGYGILKCRKKFKEGSREEGICSYKVAIVDDKRYLKWIQRKGVKICKDKECLQYAKQEVKRITNIINREMKKLQILMKT